MRVESGSEKKSRQKTRGGLMKQFVRTGLSGLAHLPTQMRPYPDAEHPSAQQRVN